MQEFLKAHGFVYKKPKGIPGKHSLEENYYEQEISFKLWHGTSNENADKIVKNS